MVADIVSFIQEDTRFHNIWKALSVGYRDTTGWWYSIDLLRRYLLLIVLPLFPGKTVRHSA